MRNRSAAINTSFPPNLLGAHRYTISDGMCALPGDSCGGHCPCCACPKGEATLPLRRRKKRLPYCTLTDHDNDELRRYRVLRALCVAERRLADAKVFEHTHIRRQLRRWK